MKKLFIIILLLLLSCNVYANDYDSQQSGDWSRTSDNADSPWYDNGVQSGWAAAPGAADTVTIQVGDVVTIDGDISVGNNAANDTTYNIDIAGTLVWPSAPGASWTFSASSTIRLTSAGKFYIGCSPGAPTDRLDCDEYAIVEFQTGGGIKYDIRIDGATAQLFARGCEGFPAYGAGTETRARITACAPDCLTGADRVLTLDTTVDWETNPTITNPVTGDDADVIIGTGGHASAAPLGVNHEIAEVTATPAANQITVTLANDHQVGDIVVNPTRNILFTSSSTTNHGSIYSTNVNISNPYMMSWVRVHEMGDSAGYNTSAIGRDASNVAHSLGTIEYTWATNCYDGAATTHCWYLEGDWDVFKYNGAYNVDINSRGFQFNSHYMDKTLEGITVIAGGAYGLYTNPTYEGIHYDKCWFSSGTELLISNALSVKDCLFHQSTGYLMNITQGDTWERRIFVDVQNNEFRNSTNSHGVMFYPYNGIFINNDFDNCHYRCLQLAEAGNVQIHMETNTFDGCNMIDNVSYGAFYISAETCGLYSQGDIYGATTLNNRSNIKFHGLSPNSYSNQMNKRLIFNETILNGPANPVWAFPISSTCWTGANGWWCRQYFGGISFATFHNLNGVEGAHWGFGAGGMIIERVTGAGPVGGWVNNTLNLKIIPYAADTYNRVSLGKIHVDSGDVLTVDLQIQKNQAAALGRRPRLMLKGCGFNPTTDYDEMADVNNAWDTVQVSGTANAKGVVHVYIEVLNDLNPALPTYPLKCLDPPTIVLYVDGVAYTKT